jgi:hypothetical protein
LLDRIAEPALPQPADVQYEAQVWVACSELKWRQAREGHPTLRPFTALRIAQARADVQGQGSVPSKHEEKNFFAAHGTTEMKPPGAERNRSRTALPEPNGSSECPTHQPKLVTVFNPSQEG